VLGEKSAKNMRGEKMEDVIFNGTEVRKATGMAEVNLTLQDVEGADSLGFSEFKEITITRRLYRSGESEYLINKIPCRLKDIRDLLMDTGVGSRAYSIIEQGKIGQLITSKPEERRFIIEEVAGITKYKSRKNEALSKLKETEDNLSRVSDIIHEVKRQIGSLDRQAKKAERYKKLSAELRGLELKMSWDDYNVLLAKSQEVEEEHEMLSSRQSAARNSVSAREADLSEARLQLVEKERTLMEHQREVHRLESEVSRLEARAEVAENQLKNLDEREERRLSEMGQLKVEEEELHQQASSLREEEQALKSELDGLRSELQSLEAEYQEKTDGAHALEQEIEHGRVRLFDMQAEISSSQNVLTRLEERRAALEIRSARALEERRETEENLSAAKLAAEKKRMELEAARSSNNELEAERDGLSAKVDETRASLKRLSDELAAGREKLSQKSNRLKSLKELEEGLEGLNAGVKAVISENKLGALPGIRGLVADILSANPEHERAIEAVLGERLQNLIVGGHDDAKFAIAFLKTRGAGRGSFLPALPKVFSCSEAPPGEGIIGPALSLSKVKDGYKDILKSLLGHVLVVRDLDSAFTIWERGVDWTLVTLDGEVVEPSGAVTGGAGGTGGILSKKREIRELTEEVESLSRSNQAAEDRLSESRALMEELEGKLKGLHEIINEKRVVLVGLEKDTASLAAELERITKKLEVLDIEASQRSQEEDEIRESAAKTRAALEELGEKKNNAESALFALQENLKAAKSALERDREALTAKKMDLSALIQKHESWARDLKRADLKKEELERRRTRLEEEGREIAEKKDELSKGRAEAEGSINSFLSEAMAMKEQAPALQDAYQIAYDAIEGLEESLKSTRREAEAARDALGEIELKRAELKLKAEHLLETVEHNYHIRIPDIEEEFKGLQIEREQAEMDAAELKIKLEKLGPVNVGAIEEYNELMERFEFLSSQKQDLESSVARLREAIGKINKTSEELFMEAFNSINETFKTVFLSLFGGGRAELVLVPPEEGNDLLDSGLEIVAQPPGKKLQSLLLFSGGEKALIAAALTFACFLVKPSPFCVLDEVDAPLDEGNVTRFGNLLKEFADKTQFIVITHSRPTMELADALYGVTMDEPGVSRLVSVRLTEAAELAGV
jgi:chromosome segregation protein